MAPKRQRPSDTQLVRTVNRMNSIRSTGARARKSYVSGLPKRKRVRQSLREKVKRQVGWRWVKDGRGKWYRGPKPGFTQVTRHCSRFLPDYSNELFEYVRSLMKNPARAVGATVDGKPAETWLAQAESDLAIL